MEIKGQKRPRFTSVNNEFIQMNAKNTMYGVSLNQIYICITKTVYIEELIFIDVERISGRDK